MDPVVGDAAVLAARVAGELADLGAMFRAGDGSPVVGSPVGVYAVLRSVTGALVALSGVVTAAGWCLERDIQAGRIDGVDGGADLFAAAAELAAFLTAATVDVDAAAVNLGRGCAVLAQMTTP